jgi:hypothetical protein
MLQLAEHLLIRATAADNDGNISSRIVVAGDAVNKRSWNLYYYL